MYAAFSHCQFCAILNIGSLTGVESDAILFLELCHTNDSVKKKAFTYECKHCKC